MVSIGVFITVEKFITVFMFATFLSSVKEIFCCKSDLFKTTIVLACLSFNKSAICLSLSSKSILESVIHKIMSATSIEDFDLSCPIFSIVFVV